MSGIDLTPALEFKSVRKVYPGANPVVALKKIDLVIEAGAFCAVVGPSGSGKSTLLQIGAGLDQATEGEVCLGGKLVTGKSNRELCVMRRENAGFIFQAYNLFPHLTALENTEFTCLIRGDSRSETRRIATECMEKVGLRHKLHSFPNQLSGGEQQRVAVARALASRPAIIFADEPTANLDSRNALDLIQLFQELNQSEKATFLFSSHDLRLVERARSVYEMLDGELSAKRA
jgi:putative ABC transport system ATP-binding protein